jgi:hypothetical protein
MKEREIFLEALDIATPEARAAFVRTACGQSAILRRKVEELLKEHFSNDSLLAGPAWEGHGPDTFGGSSAEVSAQGCKPDPSGRVAP